MSRRWLTLVSFALAAVAVAWALGLTALQAQVDESAEPRFRALVFSKVTNFYHESIPHGVTAIETLGAEHGFEVVASDDSAQFTDEHLATFDVVIFNNTNSTPEKGNLLDAEQREAFQRYIRGGGGYVGIHSASGTERDWAWYGQLVGAFFESHPAVQELEVEVEDRRHPSTTHLPAPWIRTEEPYDFASNPRGQVRVLARYDTATYEDHTMGDDHPISWCQELEGGRSWYTGMGHAPEAFTDEPLFVQHLLGGIEWAAGAAEGDCSPADKAAAGRNSSNGHPSNGRPAVGQSDARARAAAGVGTPGVDWPSFRGPRASGIAEGFPTPVRWSVDDSTGVAWKTPIPGLGHSSPVVWQDRVCVTTAISGKADAELKVGLYGDITPVDDPTTHEWRVLCLDKETGTVAWSETAHRGVPQVKRHTKATHANTTLATDGAHLVAFFGSEGLYVYRLADGELLWKKDLGLLDSGFFQVPDAQWGFASSPVIHDGTVIIQADVQKDSFIAAFAIEDGREIWRTPRQDVPTWSTPGLLDHEGGVRIIANGWHEIAGYAFATGKKLWTMEGGGDIPVPTPVVGQGLVFITNAHGALSPIYAIRPGATGDITLQGDARSNEHIAWSTPREGAYMQTPLVYGDHLYSSKDNGVLSVYEAATGTRLYQVRLGDGTTGFTASPVAADGKVYFTSEDGDVHVIKAGPAFEPLAENSMGEVCMATPAISEGRLYFRTRGHLVAIGE